jgi:hypothetical protein
MKGRRANHTLHLSLLRARAAAARIELALAVRDISHRVDTVRRAADSIGSLVDALRSRRRALTWLATATAALAPARWLRRALTGAAATLRSGATLRVGGVALAALAVVAVGLVLRRRSEGRGPKSPARQGDETG